MGLGPKMHALKQNKLTCRTPLSFLRPLPILLLLCDLWPWHQRCMLANNHLSLALSSFSHAWSCTASLAKWHTCQYSVLIVHTALSEDLYCRFHHTYLWNKGFEKNINLHKPRHLFQLVLRNFNLMVILHTWMMEFQWCWKIYILSS